MKNITLLLSLRIMVVLAPAGAGQEKKPEVSPPAKEVPAAEISFPEEERGMVDFGFRTFWGDVSGRPDLPFKPDLANSKMNEYTDIRKNFYVRRARINQDDLFGTSLYLSYQTQSSFFRNQSHLGTFGQWNKFKLQIRYDEIPHRFTNTARTPY